jgi:hypothetical protein
VIPELGEELVGQFLDRAKLVAPQVRAIVSAQTWKVSSSPSKAGTQRPMTQLHHKYTCHWTMPGTLLDLSQKAKKKDRRSFRKFD